MWLRVNAARSQPALQSDTPGRTPLILHPSCEGQLNSTCPKQDLDLFFDICRVSGLTLVFFICWEKNPKIVSHKILKRNLKTQMDGG